MSYRLVLPPVKPKEHDVLHILMLSDHVTNLSHTLKHPEVEYTLELRKEIRLVKIMDERDMQLRDEMARPMKVQW